MATRIHPKNVHEKSPKNVHEMSPKSVHEMSPLMSTRCHLLCPRNVCHPCTYYGVCNGAIILLLRTPLHNGSWHTVGTGLASWRLGWVQFAIACFAFCHCPFSSWKVPILFPRNFSENCVKSKQYLRYTFLFRDLSLDKANVISFWMLELAPDSCCQLHPGSVRYLISIEH